jgi:hypothetical protein
LLQGDVLLWRRFVKETFRYGDALLRRRFVGRRFVEETFCKKTFSMCADVRLWFRPLVPACGSYLLLMSDYHSDHYYQTVAPTIGATLRLRPSVPDCDSDQQCRTVVPAIHTGLQFPIGTGK